MYHEEFNKYMQIDGAALEDVFDYLFDMGAKKVLSEKEISICLKPLMII